MNRCFQNAQRRFNNGFPIKSLEDKVKNGFHYCLQVYNVIFVDVCTEKDSWIDMYLMSLCHHNIIANSTFSWWAAYLNQNPDRIAVSPAWWFRKDNKDYHGPLVNNSIQLDCTGIIR